MKKLFTIYALLVVCLIMSLVVLSSCDDSDDNDNGAVTLLSFGPAGVKHGENIKFIGEHLNKVTSIVIPPAIEIPSSQFVSQSAGLIELTIPNEAEAGKLVLKTPDGDIETKTVLSFEVPVTISSITPEAKPGTNITITGEFVNWIEEVIFKDEISVTEFVSKSVNELVVTVPMEAQTGFLTFSSGGTEPMVFESENELVVTLPEVTSISPESVKHTDNVTLNGTNLDLVTSVKFPGGTTVSSFSTHTESQIVVQVPANAIKGKLTLIQASPVTVTTAMDLTIILPVGTNLAPQPATPGVSTVTITGTNLDLVAKLKLVGKTAPIEVLSTAFTTQSPTQISFTLPADADNGSVNYTTIHGYSNLLGVSVIIPGAGPPPLAITLFDDQIAFGGGDWSWGGTSTPGSTEQSYSGTKSWKHTTSGSDGGPSAGGMTGVDASGMTSFKFSLFGGPGTEGKQVAVILNDNWGNYNSVTLKEGQWTQYSIPLTSYPAITKSNITRWIFKIESASNVTLYVDRVGFD